MSGKLKNVPRMEFIGKNVEVVKSTNKTLIGMKGKIVDETKNTLVIENEKGVEKKMIKKMVTMKMNLNGRKLLIDGNILQGRPEDRIKKKIRI